MGKRKYNLGLFLMDAATLPHGPDVVEMRQALESGEDRKPVFEDTSWLTEALAAARAAKAQMEAH